MKKQSGIIADREFASFYALPEPDETEVFIGMTVYESQSAFRQVSQSMMQNPVSQSYFATFTPVAVQYAASATNE